MPNNFSRKKAFQITQRNLALWYTCITALILLFSGLVIHRLFVHARWLGLEKEIRETAILLESRIEPVVTEPGQIGDNARDVLPELCTSSKDCSDKTVSEAQQNASIISGLIDPEQQAEICIRLVDQNDDLIAYLQLPASPKDCFNPKFWRRMRDSRGTYYHGRYLLLSTPSQSFWGKIHIAKSLNALDIYILRVELALAGVILGAIFMAAFASWWLAKLAMRPVYRSYQQIEQFTADAAHELRSPLAALRAMVQAALRSDNLSPQEVQETLQILNRQSQRLSSLVQDLLMFSHIEQSAEKSSFQVCCLNQILTELMDEFMAIAVSSDIAFKHHIQAPHSLYVLGDSNQLHRAIANLISNALKYTPSGGMVTVTLGQDSNYACIHVQDTGIGIPQEEQSRIFDRFYRVNQDRSSRQGGSGLGLAIAQAIVQAHHGTLTVSSQEGQGSQFRLCLPQCNKANPS